MQVSNRNGTVTVCLAFVACWRKPYLSIASSGLPFNPISAFTGSRFNMHIVLTYCPRVCLPGTSPCGKFVPPLFIEAVHYSAGLLLATTGCSWLLLAAPRCSSLLVVAPRCSSLLLAAPGCFWLLLVAPGCSWLFLAAPGCSWLLLAIPSCS